MSQEVSAAEEVQFGQDDEQGAGAAEAAVMTQEQERHEAQVREPEFASLSGASEGAVKPSMDLIMDLEVDVCAELGRTVMLVRDLMELHPGSIIELRKVAGEPVDLLANGKLVARGEVVVVDETFGVRVTEIVSRGVRFGGAS